MYDAVVVGARCAGSVLAGQLARQGWRVLLVDKATFPSDTVSTHFMFPNTIARFDTLGILERLRTRHECPPLQLYWTILGHTMRPDFTPIDGHGAGTSVRRVALDAVLVDWAAEGGAELKLGRSVVGLLGAGTAGNPVRGVVLDGGEEVGARWVLGADGRASTVAGLLGLEKSHEMQGEQAYLFAYWRGLPERDHGSLTIHDDHSALMWNPSEDGVHLVSYAGPPELTRGTAAQRTAAYQAGLRSYPEVIDPATLESAEQISDLVVVPETMLRGFFRQANGPGWALVGDAGHFKHPSTAQGISDAVEQAVYVAGALSGADDELSGYDAWRTDRSEGHYELSFSYARWPRPGKSDRYFAGLSGDPAASQDWADVFSRLKRPKDVDTPERLAAWFA